MLLLTLNCFQELEALSNHYALLFNRRKAKLSSEQKSTYDGKLKQVQQIFSLTAEVDGNGVESDKGKKVETGSEGSTDELKNLHDTSVSKAADMAAGYALCMAIFSSLIEVGSCVLGLFSEVILAQYMRSQYNLGDDIR